MKRPEYHIIVKYLKVQASEVEQGRIFNWISSSDANQMEFLKLKEIWDNYGQHHENYAIKVQPQTIIGRLGEYQFKANRLILKVAAVLFLLVVSSLAIIQIVQNIKPDEVSYASSKNGKEIWLEDGSLIVLKAGSSIKTMAGFNIDQRNIELQGEAYFKVAKDKEKPFIIRNGSLTITVLGTSFLISPSAHKTAISLFEGKVNVSTSFNEKISLNPNQTAIYTKEMTIRDSVDPNDLSWYSNTLIFNREVMYKVIETLERHYEVTISVPQEVSMKYLTATFQNQSIDEVLEVIADIHDFKVINNLQNKNYTIKK